eukprot:PhM_4_TR3108/c0_g2_i1/m.23079
MFGYDNDQNAVMECEPIPAPFDMAEALTTAQALACVESRRADLHQRMSEKEYRQQACYQALEDTMAYLKAVHTARDRDLTEMEQQHTALREQQLRLNSGDDDDTAATTYLREYEAASLCNLQPRDVVSALPMIPWLQRYNTNDVARVVSNVLWNGAVSAEVDEDDVPGSNIVDGVTGWADNEADADDADIKHDVGAPEDDPAFALGGAVVDDDDEEDIPRLGHED